MSEYSHCLRPVFTENIVKQLQRGRSINLVGAEGTGRGRLLEDIRNCELPGVKVVIVNAKSYRASYDGLIKAIWEQLGRSGTPPEKLSDIFERYTQNIWLFLNNFDALLNTTQIDNKYDIAFLDTLNNIRNMKHSMLLCVSKSPHKKMLLQVDNDFVPASDIDLELIRIPTITYSELKNELNRQQLDISDDEKMQIISDVYDRNKAFRRLNYFIDSLTTKASIELTFTERLRQWSIEFDNQEKNKITSLRLWLNVRNRVHAFLVTSGLNRIRPFVKLWLFIERRMRGRPGREDQ